MGQVRSPVDRPQAAAHRPRTNSRAHSPPRRKPNRPPNSPPPRAPGAARLPSAYPLPPLPSSSRWMMLSMLSLSISAIAFPPPDLPQRRRRRLAPGTHASFPTPRAQRRWWQQPLRVPPPTAPLPASSFSPLEPREEQNGRRLLTSLGRRTDARGGVQRPGRDFFMGHRARRRGRGQGAGKGRGQSAGRGRRRLRVSANARDPSAKRVEQIDPLAGA